MIQHILAAHELHYQQAWHAYNSNPDLRFALIGGMSQACRAIADLDPAGVGAIYPEPVVPGNVIFADD